MDRPRGVGEALMGLRIRTDSDATATRQVLMLMSGGLYFVLPAEIVRGIAGEHSEPTDETMASLGVTTPIAEFGELFAVGSDGDPAEARVIVCGTTRSSRAFRVDRLLGLQDLNMADFRPLPAHFTGPERQWFAGVFLYGTGIALLVNPGWLVGCEPETGRVPRMLPSESATSAQSAPAAAVTVEDDLLGVIELEEASDAEGLPWAQL